MGRYFPSIKMPIHKEWAQFDATTDYFFRQLAAIPPRSVAD